MIKRMPNHTNDESCPSCVIAGDFIFLSHHTGGFESNDVVYQMNACFQKLQETLKSTGATLHDMVQINLYLRNIEDIKPVREVFFKYFNINGFPARTSITTDFVNKECLCMLDGIAYKITKKAQAEAFLHEASLFKQKSFLTSPIKAEQPSVSNQKT